MASADTGLFPEELVFNIFLQTRALHSGAPAAGEADLLPTAPFPAAGELGRAAVSVLTGRCNWVFRQHLLPSWRCCPLLYNLEVTWCCPAPSWWAPGTALPHSKRHLAWRRVLALCWARGCCSRLREALKFRCQERRGGELCGAQNFQERETYSPVSCVLLRARSCLGLARCQRVGELLLHPRAAGGCGVRRCYGAGRAGGRWLAGYFSSGSWRCTLGL